jgi:tetratricopeptide (TPR) repeat protein
MIASLYGSTSVPVALQRAEQMQGRVDGNRRLESTILRARARLEGMQGNFELARELGAQGLALCDELGLEIQAAGVRSECGDIELLAGRPEASEAFGRPACEALERVGSHGHYVTCAVGLAEAILMQGRLDEASVFIERIADWAIADDMDPQIGWRRLKARVLAQRGDFETAESLGREAVELAARGDYIDMHARALADLGDVLRLAGRTPESLVELEHAVRLFEQKGNLVLAVKTRALADSLA